MAAETPCLTSNQFSGIMIQIPSVLWISTNLRNLINFDTVEVIAYLLAHDNDATRGAHAVHILFEIIRVCKF